jgi:two-component system, chemotaxis family, chemotaxis protein CheY
MRRNILIVDDSESVRAMLIFPLQQAGFNILVGHDGADALKYLDGKTIDLMITDLYMPRMDGISFIRKAREIEAYKNTPILLLTTESTGKKKIEAKTAGATGWLIKPFNIGRLLNIIETMTGN